MFKSNFFNKSARVGFLTFIFICFLCPSSYVYGGWWGSSSLEECYETYFPIAKTKLVTTLYTKACNALFAEKPILISKIDEFLCNCKWEEDKYISCGGSYHYNGILDENCFILDEKNKDVYTDLRQAWMKQIYEDAYSDLPYDEYIQKATSVDEKLIEQWDKRKKWADCILNNEKLKEVSTDFASDYLSTRICRESE